MVVHKSKRDRDEIRRGNTRESSSMHYYVLPQNGTLSTSYAYDVKTWTTCALNARLGRDFDDFT